ncbi:hypothetical protein, partial [Thiolapillus sp.]
QAYQERLNAYQMYKRTGGNRKSSLADMAHCTEYQKDEYGLDEAVDVCAENDVQDELEDYLDIS